MKNYVLIYRRAKNICQNMNIGYGKLLNTIKKINILESLVAKSGWLSVINLTINSFETEGQILLCGVTDEGTKLDIEQCKRLFSLPATINFISDLVSDVKVENEHTPCTSWAAIFWAVLI